MTNLDHDIQEMLEAFDYEFELDSYGKSHIVQDKVKAFLATQSRELVKKVFEATKVKPRPKYETSQVNDIDRIYARGWNTALSAVEEKIKAYLNET